MKIAMFYNTGLNEGQIRDEYYIADGFRKLGVEVFHNELPEKIDLVLAFKGNNVGIEQIKEWKKKAPVWIWTFDNIDRFPQWYPIIKECDLWLGEELGRRERFIKEGLPFYYFPYHAVPSHVFYPVKLEKIWDVVFAGTPYSCTYKPDKFELLRAIQNKFSLAVYGNNSEGWKSRGVVNVFPAAFDKNLSIIYGQAKIVLGISNCQCEGYWSIRSSQALMCGAFLITRFTPQMEKELKNNVVYFQDIPDCLAKIDYYLKNEKEREEKKEISLVFAKQFLTTEQRLKELLILYENRRDLSGRQ